MQLTYRNIQYQPQNIGQATVPTGEIGIYRGAKVQFRKPVHPSAQSGFAVLTYRNAQYQSRYYRPTVQTVYKSRNNSLQKTSKVPALVD